MSEQDRVEWDATFRNHPPVSADEPPRAFASYAAAFPVTGTALDIACGQGSGSVWLAKRGLQVWGVDVSGVAIDQALALAQRYGVADRCRFDVADLDDGLLSGPAVDVVVCHRFRDPRLYRQITERLNPGGLLAICVLSRVGAAPGRFRAEPGELSAAFTGLDVTVAGEGNGEAWLLARVPTDGDLAPDLHRGVGGHEHP